MIQKIILQSPTYYYYQSITHQMHGLICLNEITSPQLKMLVAPRRSRSAHQRGQQQLLLEPFIGILESLRKQPFSLSVRCASNPIILNGIAYLLGLSFLVLEKYDEAEEVIKFSLYFPFLLS